jgi:WD40 repeat protein/tetratricopeptide (TPR) repeat protein
MSSFQVNPRLNRDALSQYRAFLVEHQKESVTKEALKAVCQLLEQETRKQTQYAQAPLSDPNSKTAREMYQVAQILTGSFLGGVMLAQTIAKEIDKADDEALSYIASMLDWGFWLPSDQKVVAQLLEDDLQMLMRVNDLESSWLSQLDKAFRYYKDAFRYNDFFQQSLQILLNLVSASKHDYGNYALMHRIGMIYLYHPDFLNVSKAEMFFINAAQSVQKETNLQMKRLLSTLTRQGSKGMIQDFDSLKRRLSSEYYFHAGVSCYVRADYERAVEYFETAYYIFSMPELEYLLAKSLLAIGRIGDCARILIGLFKKHDFYMLKTSLDSGFSSLPNVLDSLAIVRDHLLAEVRSKMQEMRTSIVENSQALQILENIDKRTKERSCFSILQARSEIELPRRWLLTPRVFESQSLIMAHSLRVNSICFSQDSRLVATASWKVIVNEVESGAEIQTFTDLKSKETINALAFSPDHRILAAAGSDKRIFIWNITTGSLNRVLEEHTQSISTLAFSPNNRFLASAGIDEQIVVWNTFTGDIVFRLKGHQNSITKVVFSPDSQLLASASLDNTIHLWDIKTGRSIRTLNRHKHAVTHLQFSSDGKLLASSSWDKTVKLWDALTGSEIQTFHGHDNGVDTVHFLFKDKYIASTSFNRVSKVCCIKLWDVLTGRELESTYGRFYSAVFSPDASKLAVASSDRSVKIMSSPEVPLSRFIAFEQKLRQELESLRRSESQFQRDPQENGRRRGERRKPSYWLDGLDLRQGKERRQSQLKL